MVKIRVAEIPRILAQTGWLINPLLAYPN